MDSKCSCITTLRHVDLTQRRGDGKRECARSQVPVWLRKRLSVLLGVAEVVAGMVSGRRVTDLGLLAVLAAAGASGVRARFGVGEFIAERITKLEEAGGQLVESACERSVVEHAVEQGLLLDRELDGPAGADVVESLDEVRGAFDRSQFREQVLAACPGESDVIRAAASVDRDADVVEAFRHWGERT